MISTIVVDDEAMVRAGLRLLIDGEPDLEVRGEAADGRAGIEVFLDVAPDVVLMNVRMPRMNGVQAAQEILRLRPAARVIILTALAPSVRPNQTALRATAEQAVQTFFCRYGPTN